MRGRHLFLFLAAGVFGLVGCGVLDGDDSDDQNQQEVDCPGDDKCEPDERPGVEVVLRPGETQTTASRLAWRPVEGASRYRVSMIQTAGKDESRNGKEVFSLETTKTHAQVPKEFRDTPRGSLKVEALGENGSIGESDEIPFACYECDTKKMYCHSVCKAPQFAYQVAIYGDQDDGSEAFSMLTGAGHFIAYSYEDYIAQSNLVAGFGNREVHIQSVQLSSDPVYDRFCSSQLTGTVYFVQSDAGPYQPDASALLTSDTYADDAEAKCGTYTGIGGKNLLFNSTSDVSPALSCPSNCNLDTGGFSGTNWGWDEMDNLSYPTPIELADDILDGSSGNDGWFDDGNLEAILRALAENLANDSGGDGTEPTPTLEGLSIQPAVPERINPEREEANRAQIVVDIKRLQREGDRYIQEILKDLDADLYVLVHYYGGTRIRPMALVHEKG